MLSRSAAIHACLLTGLLLVTFFGAFQITPGQLTSPIHLDGDVLQACRLLKSSSLEGSYYQVRDLGAPFVADHYGFPETFVIHLPLLWLLSRLTDNIYLIYNLLFLSTFVAVGLSSLAVMRSLGCHPWVALGLSWIYAFLPNHIERYDHYGVSLYATAPLMIYLAILLHQGVRPGWKAVLLVPLGALCGPYPAMFGCLTVLLGGVLGSLRHRSFRPLFWCIGLCGLVSLTFLLVLFPSLRGGGPDQAVLPHRDPGDLPRWALYLDHLSLPAHARPIHPLASVSQRYYANIPAPKEPNESPYLGLICLAAWLNLLLGNWRHPYRNSLVALSTALFVLGMGGGLGQMLHLVVGTAIRCYNRLNFHLAFVLLVGLGLRLSLRTWSRRQAWTFAFLLLLGLVEQVLSTPDRDPGEVRGAVDSDRQFVNQLEKTLPAHAMVWQMPYVAYPETRPLFEEGDYGLGRLYAVSHQIHWSWGCLKGNRQERCQAAFSQFSLKDQLEILHQTGFQGLVVERRAYADGGKDIETQLRSAGLQASIESPDRHLAFYRLAGLACEQPGVVFERLVWERAWQAGRIEFTTSGWGRLFIRKGWSDPEPTGTWTMGQRAWLYLPHLPASPPSVKIRLWLTPIIGPQGKQTLEIFHSNKRLGSWGFLEPRRYSVEFVTDLPAQLELVVGQTVQPSALGGQDLRPLGIFLHSLEVVRP